MLVDGGHAGGPGAADRAFALADGLAGVERIEIGVLAAIAGLKRQRGARFVGSPDFETPGNRGRLRRQKRHYPGLAGGGPVGDADPAIDADFGSLLPAQERLGIVEVLDDDRRSGFPGPARQSKALWKPGVP